MKNKQISQAQLEANQANAQKSTGPKTEEGKAIARFNARRHGLTGQFYCMSTEDETAYNIFEGKMLKTLQPEGAEEEQLAITITQDHWRLNRSRAVEFNLYGRGHDELAETIDAPTEDAHSAATMADTWRNDYRAYSNIALYETRIHRMIVKNKNCLTELQAERKAAEKLARDDAKLLVRLADFKGEAIESTHPIEVNGFVFPTAPLIAEINREERLKEARFHQFNGWNKTNHYRDNRSIILKAA